MSPTRYKMRNNTYLGNLYDDQKFKKNQIKGLSNSLNSNMSGSDNNTTSIGIRNPSQPFENSISASHFTLLSVLGILGITFLFCLVCKFTKKMFYHHSTANIEPSNSTQVSA